MKILLISPLAYAVNQDTRYAGIEKLVRDYANELVKEHEVAVMGHADSVFAEGVFLFPTKPQVGDVFLLDELLQYQQYQSEIRKFDVIHDFSHQHLASRYMPNLPSLNLFWHAPSVAIFPKARYNIIAPSKWAECEFRRVYNQDAKYQQSICIDTSIYKPSQKKRTDRFLSLGILQPSKGHLEAIMLCQGANVPIDIVGKGKGDEYEEQIKRACVGDEVRYLGEVNEEAKIELLQTCKALLYVNQEPEVTSYKVQEAILCGAPVICADWGALPEIISNGIDGFLCNSDRQFLEAMERLGELDTSKTYETFKDTYSIENVIKGYIPLYEQVRDGLRW